MSYVDNFLAVWNVKSLDLPEKAVLSNLCRRADAEGKGARPSELRIAIETSQSVRTVQKVLDRLRKSGWINRLRWEGSTSAFGKWQYEINLIKLLGEAEDGEEVTRELLEEERQKVRDRVAKYREKQRSQAPDVTESQTLVTESQTLRNGNEDVTVTANEGECNVPVACDLPIERPLAERPKGTTRPPPKVGGNELEAASLSLAARESAEAVVLQGLPPRSQEIAERRRAAGIGRRVLQ